MKVYNILQSYGNEKKKFVLALKWYENNSIIKCP